MKHHFIVAIALFASGCSTDGSDPKPTPDAGAERKPDSGTNVCLGTACEAQLWPRLALQLSDPALTTSDVSFEADGMQTSASSQPGCPSGFSTSPRAAEFACVAGLHAKPETQSVRVLLRRPGKDEQSWTVELASFNRCGANIAYVTLALTGDEATLSGPKYRSPCLETNAP